MIRRIFYNLKKYIVGLSSKPYETSPCTKCAHAWRGCFLCADAVSSVLRTEDTREEAGAAQHRP